MLQDISQLERLYAVILEFAVNYSFQAFGAVVIFVAGFIAAKWMSGFVVRVCENRNIDITLRTFVGHVVNLAILGFAIIMSLGKLGITITPFVAAVGALTFGAGLAIQGLLSNYGAGIAIIVTRPFVVSNTLTVRGETGIVKEIRLGATILETEDGEEITIPNRHVVGEILTNSFDYKIVEASIGIDYGDAPDIAIKVIRDVLSRHESVPASPEPQIGIDAFADSSISIGFRYWVPTSKYHQIRFAINRDVFKAILDAGIKIPYPHRQILLATDQSLPPSETVSHA